MVNRGRKTKIGSRPDLYCHSPRRKSRFQDRVTNIAIVPPRDEPPFPFLSSLFYSFPPSSSSFFRHQRFSSVSSCTAAQQQCEPTPPTIEQNRLKTYSDNEPSSVSFARLRTRARLSLGRTLDIFHRLRRSNFFFLLFDRPLSILDEDSFSFSLTFLLHPLGLDLPKNRNTVVFVLSYYTCVVISWLGQARQRSFQSCTFPE